MSRRPQRVATPPPRPPLPARTRTIEFVSSPGQIAGSHRTFARRLEPNWRLALDLVRRSTYWVQDVSDGSFSPSKFSGFVGMDFAMYSVERKRGDEPRFDGTKSRLAIESLLGPFAADAEATARLKTWLVERLGSDVLVGIDASKWVFARLPPAALGLASAAGGWEGSEELATLVADRSQLSREPPVLG